MEDAPTITIRHAENIWYVTDLQGRISHFQWRPVAIAAAYKMLADRRGLILIYDAPGRLLESIDLRTHNPYDR